jgi:hypothetical protein
MPDYAERNRDDGPLDQQQARADDGLFPKPFGIVRCSAQTVKLNRSTRKPGSSASPPAREAHRAAFAATGERRRASAKFGESGP